MVAQPPHSGLQLVAGHLGGEAPNGALNSSHSGLTRGRGEGNDTPIELGVLGDVGGVAGIRLHREGTDASIATFSL